MGTDTTTQNDKRVSVRRRQVCDVADVVVLKDLMPQLEHPFYALSKKPERTPRRYEHDGNRLEIIPSCKGLATIYDKDILIYCISQLVEKLKQGLPVSPRVHIISYDLLSFTNRGTSGRDYYALSEAIDRLAGTHIKTNIRTGNKAQEDNFGLIGAAAIRRKQGPDGRLLWVEIELSERVFNAVRAQEVVTLHRDYFRLGKPLERCIYALARQHCGRQPTWKVSLVLLLKKCGSQSPINRFRHMLKHIARHDHLPDYRVTFDDENDQVVFHNRELWWDKDGMLPEQSIDLPPLPTPTYEEARQAAPENLSKAKPMPDMNQISTKRGFPIYRTNPSVPAANELPTRPRRFDVPGGKASVIVDDIVEEIKGFGGIDFWWQEEVDRTRFVKLFLDGIKQAAGLSKTGMRLFTLVYQQMQENPGKAEIMLNLYIARDHGLTERTYQRGVRELLAKEFLYRTTSGGVFFVNIRFMFNGDRLAFVRTYHVKNTSAQTDLSLEGPPLAMPSVATGYQSDTR